MAINECYIFEADLTYKFHNQSKLKAFLQRQNGSRIISFLKKTQVGGEETYLLKDKERELLILYPGNWLLLIDEDTKALHLYDAKKLENNSIYPTLSLLKFDNSKLLSESKTKLQIKLQAISFKVSIVVNDIKGNCYLFITSKYLFILQYDDEERTKFKRLICKYALRESKIHVTLERVARGSHEIRLYISIVKVGSELLKKLELYSNEFKKICETFEKFYLKYFTVDDKMNVLDKRYLALHEINHPPNPIVKENANDKNKNSKGGIYIYQYVDVKSNLSKASPVRLTQLERGNRYEEVKLNENYSSPEWNELNFTPTSIKQKRKVSSFVVLSATNPNKEEDWCLSVMFIANDCDGSLLDRLKKLEQLCGRTVLKYSCFDVETDLAISLDLGKQTDNYSLADETEKYLIAYDKIQSLTCSSWIVNEIYFQCDNMEERKFHVSVCIHEVDNESSEPLLRIEARNMKQEVPDSKPWNTSSTTKIPLSMKTRKYFCEELDKESALGRDWKALAAEIPLEARVIENISSQAQWKKCSYTELLFVIMENDYPDKCEIKILEQALLTIKRKDLVEKLLEENNRRGVCAGYL